MTKNAYECAVSVALCIANSYIVICALQAAAITRTSYTCKYITSRCINISNQKVSHTSNTDNSKQ